MPFKDPEKKRDYQKRYSKLWEERHPGNRKERWKLWGKRHPELLHESWKRNHMKRHEQELVYEKKRRLEHPEYFRQWYLNRRKKVLEIVGKGKVLCINCGCDDIRLLEINHVNGSSYKLREFGTNFAADIFHGKRKIDDLELRCRVCNALHSHESKYGKLPYKIIFGS